MSVSLVGGPGDGQTFVARRAPILLRVVCNRVSGKWDLLNLEGDFPEASEDVFLYRKRPGTGGVAFLCRPTSGPGGRFESGVYDWLDVAVDDVCLRDTDAWVEWATAWCKVNL